MGGKKMKKDRKKRTKVGIRGAKNSDRKTRIKLADIEKQIRKLMSDSEGIFSHEVCLA